MNKELSLTFSVYFTNCQKNSTYEHWRGVKFHEVEENRKKADVPSERRGSNGVESPPVTSERDEGLSGVYYRGKMWGIKKQITDNYA